MESSKTVGIILLVIVILWTGSHIVSMLKDNIRITNTLTGFWSMADKTATIEKKSEYLDKYVDATEKHELNKGNSAVFFKHYDNDMANNYDALRSLQKRLHEIKKMDIQSFAYQTALQQLTQQEWKEATAMTGQFYYKLVNKEFVFTWGWLGWLPWTIIVIFGVIGFMVLIA